MATLPPAALPLPAHPGRQHQGLRLSAGDQPGRARRRRVGRGQPIAVLWRASAPRQPRPDGPGPRRRRHHHPDHGPELRRMAELQRDPADHARRHGRGRGSALPLAPRRRSDRHRPRADGPGLGRALAPRRLDDHPAARPQHPEDQRPQLRPKDPRGHRRAGTGMALLQGPDPRALPQPGLFRRRRLRHRFRLAPVLRPQRPAARDPRGGDHRGHGQGAVQLFADRRHGGRARPRQRGHRPDGPQQHDQPGPGGRLGPGRDPLRAARPGRSISPAISPIGCCPSST